jgi:hypothetical protein
MAYINGCAYDDTHARPIANADMDGDTYGSFYIYLDANPRPGGDLHSYAYRSC